MARNMQTCLAVALAVAAAGCTSYVKQADFDTTIADLRATDQRLQSEIDGLSQKYDTLVTQVAGRIRVETAAHFATADATISEQDKPLLDDFAKAIRDGHSNAVITVEGFTDPAGSASANRALGQRRADAVRDYLVSPGGLNAGQVRAVSYGEDENRQVAPGAEGGSGLDNRRASLVVDSAGTSSMQQPTEPQPQSPEEPTQPPPSGT